MTDTSSKTYDWAAEVKDVEGEDFLEKPVVYEFSNGRKFKEPQLSGLYTEDMQPE